ncbi:hypothetical protein AUK40_01150 [Candidatus Wirthbacteria bacterium CG2_30_54_11]|uniref:Uncharacterized protein n=1 Tax=Candidatus Wirthbacteria bacterium CG2_30_54_11 TaxID=1817892 RepID=A0A1J5J027_9BACT|nr:MAG: hypothetical protein AUK40_01150 [Candidatus Wirthbacteria bacterium CG2_30_54_11]
MRFLLINPWIYDFAAYDLWMKPLGLLYLSSVFKAYGHEVQLIDCLDSFDRDGRFGTHRLHAEEVKKPLPLSSVPRRYKRYGMPLDEFSGLLEKQQVPDAICLTSMMTYWYPGVQKAVEFCRSRFPEVPIYLGGVYATLCPEHASHILPEVTLLPGFGIDSLFQQCLPGSSSYPKGWKCEDGGLFSYEPDYGLYPDLVSASILTSIGCPLHCTYCASRTLQPAFIQRPVADVLTEIDHLIDTTGVGDIAFYDDALLWNRERHAKPLFQAIWERNYSVRFHLPNGIHIREIDEELASLLFSCHVETLRLSFESSSPDRQKDSSSKASVQDLERAVKLFVRSGYRASSLHVYVLMGLPGQSLAEVRESAAFVHSLGCQVDLAEYSPVPHTVEFKRSLAINSAIAEEPLLQNNTIFPLLSDRADFRAMEQYKSRVSQKNKQLK